MPKSRTQFPAEGEGPEQFAKGSVGSGLKNEIRRELRALLESPELRGSHRGRILLQYLVDNAVEGAFPKLKERTIGVELFHRDPSYDTGQDAIVRVAANDLRKRLNTHYQHTEASGAQAIRISLAPGSYVPEFYPGSEAPPNSTTTSKAQERVPGLRPRRVPAWIPPVLTGALITLSVAACALLAVDNARLRRVAGQRRPPNIAPWSQIITPGSSAALIVSDSNFSFFKMLVHEDRPLPDYISQHWVGQLNAALPSLPSLSLLPISSMADVSIAGSLGSLLTLGNSSLVVRSGRMMQVDDFKTSQSLILLGSAYANPWVSILNEHLNFFIEYDPAVRKQVLKNRNPVEREASVYVGTAATPLPGTSYATVSMLQNLSGRGFVLVIAGTNMEGTLAAGELATDLPRLASALRARGIEPEAKLKQLELVLRVDHLGTQASRTEVIAHRVRP